MTVAAGERINTHIFIKFLPDVTRGSGAYKLPVSIRIHTPQRDAVLPDEVSLVGPLS